jgi:hypothetical protein
VGEPDCLYIEMESNESYSVKGDQCMKEAQKKLKGRAKAMQGPSSATS